MRIPRYPVLCAVIVWVIRFLFRRAQWKKLLRMRHRMRLRPWNPRIQRILSPQR